MSITNYMEKFVLACLEKRELELDQKSLEDIQCLTLNHCRSWYVRDVRKAEYYLSQSSLLEIISEVNAALDEAIRKVLA